LLLNFLPSTAFFPIAFNRWITVMKLLGITCLSTLVLMPSLGSTETLGEAEIRRDIIGRTVYLSTPLGGELPLIFRSSGKVDGNGKAIGLGRYFKPSDSGRWWIDANRLCQKFQSWNKGRPMCFALERTGANKVKWTRDNGRTGVARIGN